MMTLDKQIILITGATGALGSTAARVFADADATLILTGRSADKLAQIEGEHTRLACDLTDEDQCNQLIHTIVEHYGRIDGLLNIAGGFAMGPKVHELSHAQFEEMFCINFSSSFNTCRSVLAQMNQQGHGNIVNVAARAALQGKAKMAPYCIAKSAVVTLTESMAAEHQHDDININCILPGTIDTPTNRADMPDADFSTWIPCEDLANTMLFLCSPLARAINGAVIPVYGKS